MFYTGAIGMNDRAIQLTHDRNHCFDDDVFSWFDKKEKKLMGHTGITYVSNIGTVATIHIKPRHNNPAYIAYIKDYFNLHDIYGISKVLIEEM